MSKIDAVFDRLEEWKNLPSYQLERRADIYFSLYLADVLAAKLDKPISPRLIPEFPLKQEESNRSYKVDYLAVSKDGADAYLVELKTDTKYLRPKQFEYLRKGATKDCRRLYADVKSLQEASRSKDKYSALITLMRDNGLVPDGAGHGPKTKHVVLIQPSDDVDPDVLECFKREGVNFTNISFAKFRLVVMKHDDPVSRRFTKFLESFTSKKK